MKFPIKIFFRTCELTFTFRSICLHLLKKNLTENVFAALQSCVKYFVSNPNTAFPCLKKCYDTKGVVLMTFFSVFHGGMQNFKLPLNQFTTNVPHHIETSQLICIANQLTSFYMKGNIGR